MNAPLKLDERSRIAATNRPTLLPVQQSALNKLLRLSDAAPVVVLIGERGSGKSTILRAFCEARGGFWLGPELLRAAAERSPHTAGDAVTTMIAHAFETHDLVVVDDLEFMEMTNRRYRDDAFQTLQRLTIAHERGKKLVAGSFWEGGLASASRHRRWPVTIAPFGVEDYRQFFQNMLGGQLGDLDPALLHRHVTGLNGYQLERLCRMMIHSGSTATSDAIGLVDRYLMRSNTRISEVERLSFDDLPGTDHIVGKLETHIIMPLQDTELAARLDLKPKRGVLLYGPPGTGKTSIGRALAHRMKGKFFLIDGNIPTEPPVRFFQEVDEVISQAKENAPCVLFIDDADVLFNIVHISGFARYLLTLLDGMESEGVGKVCIMMTAMDVTKVPSAILRSGRVELWLETRAPSLETRAAILRKWLSPKLPSHSEVDFQAVAGEAEGFNPADLRRITTDALAWFAADDAAGRKPASAQDYLSRAICELIATRAVMADNLRDESLRVGKITARAKYGMGIGGLVESSTACVTKGW